MKKIKFLLISLTLASLAKAETVPFTIERSEVFTFSSAYNDREYRIFIKTPRSYAKKEDKTYPLIFLNDGSYAFPLVSSITRQMSGGGVIEEPIIVGISYDLKTTWQIARTRDYTPTKSLLEKNRHSDEARKHSGGADKYLLFIENELMPFLRKKYRVDTQKEIYAGSSFGGLFGGFILKTKPQTFDYYLLSDPSFWYHQRSIFKINSEQSTADVNVLITSQGKKNTDNCGDCMAENAQAFSDHLQVVLPKASIEYLVLENEIHETMFPASVSQALYRFLRK